MLTVVDVSIRVKKFTERGNDILVEHTLENVTTGKKKATKSVHLIVHETALIDVCVGH